MNRVMTDDDEPTDTFEDCNALQVEGVEGLPVLAAGESWESGDDEEEKYVCRPTGSKQHQPLPEKA